MQMTNVHILYSWEGGKWRQHSSLCGLKGLSCVQYNSFDYFLQDLFFVQYNLNIINLYIMKSSA